VYKWVFICICVCVYIYYVSTSVYMCVCVHVCIILSLPSSLSPPSLFPLYPYRTNLNPFQSTRLKLLQSSSSSPHALLPRESKRRRRRVVSSSSLRGRAEGSGPIYRMHFTEVCVYICLYVCVKVKQRNLSSPSII